MKPASDLKPIRLDLTDDEHQQLRILAAMAGTSMAAYAREIIRAAMADTRTSKP